MKIHITLLGAAMLMASAAHAEPATTTKATELLAQAFADAKTVASLPADTRFDVLKRSGAWSEVKTSAGQTGWVRQDPRSRVGWRRRSMLRNMFKRKKKESKEDPSSPA